MGRIVGAALVSHHPGLLQDPDFRVMMGNGKDSDLIDGAKRIRERIDMVRPDALVIFDTHWFTTGYHLYDAGARYSGNYTSDEMPWYLFGQDYDYAGAPELARLCETVATERGVMGRAVDDPKLPRQYATLNIIKLLNVREPVLTVGNCQNCETEHFLESGEVVGEAIRRSGLRVMLIASGALSHKFNGINWQQKNPRIYDPENVSSPANVASDHQAIDLFREGRHDEILARFPGEYARLPWEGLGGHYLQMIGAMGGAACRAKGEPVSEYENARGTGNINIWFDCHGADALAGANA